MDPEAGFQCKQERLRTRWTAALDKIFADLVVEQIQRGNRSNNVFDKKTWNHIRSSFNKRTDLNFNNNQLRKHLDVLRTRYHNLKPSVVQSNFTIDDSCYFGFDLCEDIGLPPTVKAKECPIYDQLCVIFTDSVTDGKYAQSSHYEELNKSIGKEACLDDQNVMAETPSSSRCAVQGKVAKVDEAVGARRKRLLERGSQFRECGWDHGMVDVVGEAMLGMVGAYKSMLAGVVAQDDCWHSIGGCIKALDEMEGIDEEVYLHALELFEEPEHREIFIRLGGHGNRLAWLLDKYNGSHLYGGTAFKGFLD